MSRVTRLLLIAEVIVGFGLVVALWLYCLLLSFLSLFFKLLFHGLTDDIPLYLLSAAGACGLWSMFQLVLIVLYAEKRPNHFTTIVFGLLIAYFAIAWFLYPFSSINIGFAFMILPILVSLHFLYLAHRQG
jgi:hypothetical protein